VSQDGCMPNRSKGPHVIGFDNPPKHGVQPHGRGFRYWTSDGKGAREASETFPTFEEALASARRVAAALARDSQTTVDEAVGAYEEHLEAKGNKPNSVKETVRRIRRFFGAVDIPLASLTEKRCRELYDELVASAPAEAPRRTLEAIAEELRRQEWTTASQLAAAVGLTRSGAAKCVSAMRRAGWRIDAHYRKGYRMTGWGAPYSSDEYSEDPDASTPRLSADTHRNYLAEAKTFLNWCLSKKWISRNPLADVKGVGRRRRGKQQLRIDEARRWLNQALVLADKGDAGAVAASLSLLMGLRASEIVRCQVRDLDDGGQLLWIVQSKTEAGRRRVVVPPVLQGYLKRLAEGKKGDELLFGAHWRDWISAGVQRICELAGVPVVCAHSMRGLHASLAMAHGITGAVVAGALGHEHESTTTESYAQREAVEKGRQGVVLEVLTGGKK